MPIAPFLKGEKFDAETKRAMDAAREMACVALRTGDCADDEPNPPALCEQALKDMRTEASTQRETPTSSAIAA
jgi:hypothetical protein